MRHILVLRAGALGDVLLGLPALRALRGRFPQAHITLAAPLPQARVASWDPLVDRVVGFDEPALAPLIAGDAADWPPHVPLSDVAVVWLSDYASVSACSRRLGAGEVMGCAPLDAVVARRHMADWLAESVAVLGVNVGAGNQTVRAPVAPAPGALVVHPGSGSARKNWPQWANVLAQLRPGKVTVLCGDADKQPVAALLERWPTGVPRPTVLEPLSLEDLAGVLAGASLYLGNDSGVTHLAAALGAPTVAVFGPTDPNIWSPVGPRVSVVGGMTVTSGIFADTARWPSVEEVVRAARGAALQAE